MAHLLATREKKEGWKKKRKTVRETKKRLIEVGRVQRAPVTQNIARIKAEIAKDEKALIELEKDLKKYGEVAREYVTEKRKVINLRLKKNRLKLKGTEKRETKKIKHIHLKMSYTIRVYQGGKTPEDIPQNPMDDYFAIRFRSQEEYNDKLEEAKYMLRDRADYQLVSGTEILMDSVVYEVDNTLTLKQLRATASNPAKIPFYKATIVPIDYQFLPVDLNYDEPTGKKVSCLDRYILKTYKKDMPTLCQEELDEIMGDVDVLDEQIDPNAPEGIAHRTCEAAQRWCAKRKVAHYALDVKGNIFYKNLNGSQNNYKPLVYYVADAHMYVCNHQGTIRYFARIAADYEDGRIEANINKSNEKKIAEMEEDKFLQYRVPDFEDTPVELLRCLPKGCNVYYHLPNLSDIARKLMKGMNVVGTMKYSGDQMTKIYLKKWGLNLLSNPNHRFKMDWNESKKVCEALDLRWTNQGLPELINEYFAKSFHVKGEKMWERRHIPAEAKRMVQARQKGICGKCRLPYGNNFDIDHIIGLFDGGHPFGSEKNGVQTYDNLQVLCRPCHTEKTRRDKTQRVFKIDQSMSSYNDDVAKIFHRAKNGFLHNFDLDKAYEGRVKQGRSILVGYDINKCRTELLYRNTFPFCVFSCLDDVKEFCPDDEKHKVIPPGYYYVKSWNLLPLKGSGWYSYPIVRFCLEKKIIKLQSITHCVFPGSTLPCDYYKQFVETVRDKLDIKMAKICINSFIGCFGHKVTKERSVHFTRSLNEASYLKFTTNETGNRRVYVHRDGDLLEVITNNQSYAQTNRVPLFNHILDLEAIEMYKLKEILCSEPNTKPIHYNTDNVIVECKGTDMDSVAKRLDEKINQCFWDPEKKFPKYKPSNSIHNPDRTEKNDNGEVMVDTSMETEGTMVYQDYKMKELEWNVVPDPGTNDFRGLIKKTTEILEKESLQIDGRAGTGKTTLAKGLIDALTKKYGGDKILRLAPTNKAARVLGDGAETLHTRWAIMTSSKFNVWNFYEVIVVDEKSMVLEHFWDSMAKAKRTGATCRFLIVGDWEQLPPVEDRPDGFSYQNTRVLWELSGGNMLKLDHCRRADIELFNLCMDVSLIDINDFKRVLQPRSLCYNNKCRKKVNAYWMDHYAGGAMLELPWDEVLNKEGQAMKVTKGMPIVAYATVSGKGYSVYNCEDFKVVRWNLAKKEITIETAHNDGKEEVYMVMPFKVFTAVMCPGYCISIYKSQGVTWSEPYSILQFEKMKMMGNLGKKLLYVAFSRATSKDIINIAEL